LGWWSKHNPVTEKNQRSQSEGNLREKLVSEIKFERDGAGKGNGSESFYDYENEPTGSRAVECGRVGGEHAAANYHLSFAIMKTFGQDLP
jgi:hypothetical protein